LINLEKFKHKQGSFLRLILDKNLKSRFILNLITKIAGFYVCNKNDYEKNIVKDPFQYEP
jgi:hypothetical protein